MQRSSEVERTQTFDDSPSSDRITRDSETGGGRVAGAKQRLGNLFSPRAFLLALVLSVGGMALASAVPIVGSLPVVGPFMGFLGLFAAAFVVGLVGSHRRYLETGTAGAVAAGLGFVLNSLLFAFATDVGLQFAAAGAAGGAIAALLGHYFGRDLRDGLTKDI